MCCDRAEEVKTVSDTCSADPLPVRVAKSAVLMDLRRDYVIDQMPCRPLTLEPLRRVPSKSLSCEHVFRSSVPQREHLDSLLLPKEFEVHCTPISYGGRVLGPTSYALSRDWTSEPTRATSQFASKVSRLHTPAEPLSAQHEFLVATTTTQQSVKASAPFTLGRTWTSSPRGPIPPKRDPGLEKLTDPHMSSFATRVEGSQRHYRASFHSNAARLHKDVSMTGSGVGPGSYNTSSNSSGGASGQRTLLSSTSTPSSMFQAPRHSREVRQSASLKKLLRQEAGPYGGTDWVRSGSIDRHWTSKKTHRYY